MLEVPEERRDHGRASKRLVVRSRLMEVKEDGPKFRELVEEVTVKTIYNSD